MANLLYVKVICGRQMKSIVTESLVGKLTGLQDASV